MLKILCINWSDTAVISSIIGVLGTLLGTILGYLLNLLSNKGKLKIYLRNEKLTTFQDDDGNKTNRFYSFEAEFILTNLSNETKSVIKPYFIIKNNKEETSLGVLVREIKHTHSIYDVLNKYKEYDKYDILPQSSIFMELSSCLKGKNILLNPKTKLYFCYITNKNKTKKIKLKVKYEDLK